MKLVRWTVGLVGGGLLTFQWLGRTWGSTRAERRRVLPGDEIVRDPQFVTTHATTIDADPETIWPWLAQMGWHQGGWYTSEWVDRLLFPANRPAADEIIAELQNRQVGDFIPDGPPESECGFVIERIDHGKCLVLHSTSHIPLSWRENVGAWVDWTWSFVLDDLGGGRTRFLFRCRGRTGPWWMLAGAHLALAPADFVMSGQMMRGVKARAERTPTRGTEADDA